MTAYGPPMLSPRLIANSPLDWDGMVSWTSNGLKANCPRGWVETTEGRVLRVFRAGLQPAGTTAVAIGNLRINPTRGTDGAR